MSRKKSTRFDQTTRASCPNRDPFDRLLAGQAELVQLVLLTADPQLSSFSCQTLW